jgi:hypothetical protein
MAFSSDRKIVKEFILKLKLKKNIVEWVKEDRTMENKHIWITKALSSSFRHSWMWYNFFVEIFTIFQCAPKIKNKNEIEDLRSYLKSEKE